MKFVHPTTRPVNIYSDCCDEQRILFVTNEEIQIDVCIQMWCQKCKKTVEWRMK